MGEGNANASQRIDNVTVDGSGDLYLDAPGEFLVKQCVAQLLATPEWAVLFGENIDSYKREDYSERDLPCLRVYSERYKKEFESWFINGDITLDILWPANIRRQELEQIPDTVANALLQQFRRTTFFTTLDGLVPGLNELGKEFAVDKSMAFDYGGDDIVPLTQITVNFRIDLREWDSHLEADSRTKDDPFNRTLANLKKIASTIQGLRDDNTVETTVQIDQKIGE